jgi:hypothetical protein
MIQVTGKVELKFEDSRQAAIAEIGEDDGFFVRLQSWSEDKTHPILERLAGKKVRITIEELP